ncbi:MAG: helix-turn-helix transcriptional regulator [Clostridia bacterium]|nr:helix-turn-helix transcriptional regulator [Clostridia bacterium]
MRNVYREIKTELQFEKLKSIDFAAHIHEDIELVYVKKGRSIAYCDGKKYILNENSFFLAFPNQVHRYMHSLPGEYILLVIKPSLLLGYGDIFIDGQAVSAVHDFEENTDDNIIYLYETALYEYERDGLSTVIEAYLTALFGKLLKYYYVEKSQVSHDTVLQILQYCAQHYKENITINDIAEELHVSRSCVSHIFSNRIAINFCEYINSLRLADARKFLKNKNYSITEVAEMSGFSTIRTFNRAFFKQFNMSPSEYRKTLMSRQNNKKR